MIFGMRLYLTRVTISFPLKSVNQRERRLSNVREMKMEATNAVDLYATQGIEYVFIIVYLAALIIFWKFLNKNSKRTMKKVKKLSNQVIPEQPVKYDISMKINSYKNRFYSKD